MIYLRVMWIDGSDEDLFRFKTLDKACEYIQEEGIKDFVLSDVQDYEEIGLLYKESDYSLIED